MRALALPPTLTMFILPDDVPRDLVPAVPILRTWAGGTESRVVEAPQVPLPGFVATSEPPH